MRGKLLKMVLQMKQSRNEKIHPRKRLCRKNIFVKFEGIFILSYGMEQGPLILTGGNFVLL